MGGHVECLFSANPYCLQNYSFSGAIARLLDSTGNVHLDALIMEERTPQNSEENKLVREHLWVQTNFRMHNSVVLGGDRNDFCDSS